MSSRLQRVGLSESHCCEHLSSQLSKQPFPRCGRQIRFLNRIKSKTGIPHLRGGGACHDKTNRTQQE